MQKYITVFTPLYNAENYIAESIESVLNQNCNNFDYIIYDDGSSDDSAKIAASYASKYDRIKLILGGDRDRIYKNEAHPCNAGYKLAKTPYVARLDADDTLDRHAIASISKLIKSQPDSDLYCLSRRFMDTSIISKQYDYSYLQLLTFNMLDHFRAVKLSTFYKLGGYRGEMDYVADYDFMLRLAESRAKIIKRHDIVYNYRTTANLLSRANKKEMEQAVLNCANASCKRVGLNATVYKRGNNYYLISN